MALWVTVNRRYASRVFSAFKWGNSPDIFCPPCNCSPTLSAPENLLHNSKNSETTWVTVMGGSGRGMPHPRRSKGTSTPIYAEYAPHPYESGRPGRHTCPGRSRLSRKHRSGSGRQGAFSRLRERFSFRTATGADGPGRHPVLLIACANIAQSACWHAPMRGKRRSPCAWRLVPAAALRIPTPASWLRAWFFPLAGGIILACCSHCGGSRFLVGMLAPGSDAPWHWKFRRIVVCLGFTLAISILTGLLLRIGTCMARAIELAINSSLHQERVAWPAESRGFAPGKARCRGGSGARDAAAGRRGASSLRRFRNLVTVDRRFPAPETYYRCGSTSMPPAYSAAPNGRLSTNGVASMVSEVPGVSAASLVNRGLMENGRDSYGAGAL